MKEFSLSAKLIGLSFTLGMVASSGVTNEGMSIWFTIMSGCSGFFGVVAALATAIGDQP